MIHRVPNLILGRGPCSRPTKEGFLSLPQPRVMGIFSWKLIDSKTKQVKAEGSTRNLITNVGLDSMSSTRPSTSASFVGVGTGSSAPAVTQTTLDAELARTNRKTTGDTTVTSGPSFSYWSVVYAFLFIESEANGNLTEVGMFNQASGGVLFSRQLFKDGTGTPTTVTKTSSDQLQINYELRVYPPTVDTTQSGLVISGISYDITTRACKINSGTAWGYFDQRGWLSGAGAGIFGAPGGIAFDSAGVLGATTSTGITGAGGSAAASSSVSGTYTNGNFFNDITMKWEPAVANYVGGIGGFNTFGSVSNELFQSKFTPAFAKDSTMRLTLVVRCSWARYP